MLAAVLSAYGLNEQSSQIEPIKSGLINYTWKVASSGKEYILQKLNNAVFENPESIAYNIKVIADYLKINHPEYCFVAPVTANNGQQMIYLEDEGFFRLFPFVAGSHTIDVVETPEQAFEAASQFGRFTKLLNGIDINDLRITIDSFHDLSLRYGQFLAALGAGDQQRVKESQDLIDEIIKLHSIVDEYQQIRYHPEFKLRVTHHDTKISNVLFNHKNKGLCVIDLDTVMPGYFISDLGDMMRTYLSPVSEEESDFEKIEVREEFYKAIVRGYVTEMKDELTATEKGYFFYAARFMIYMQAVRFLTDFLNNDIYYGARYERQNYVRANNQMVLLQRLLEQEAFLSGWVCET